MKPLFITLPLSFCFSVAFSQSANVKLSNLVAPTAVNQSLLPGTTNTKDLGAASYARKDLYLGGQVFLGGTRFLSIAPGSTSFNTFVGALSGRSVTSGYRNTATGAYTLYATTSGYANTATGAYTLFWNTSGWSNTAVGTRALFSNTIGYRNTAI